MSIIVDNPAKQVLVIMIDGRFFSNFGKKGQVLTAWSIGGARNFVESSSLHPVLQKLKAKGKKYTVEQVELFERVNCYPPREFFKLRYRLERMLANSHNYHTPNSFVSFNVGSKCNLVEQVAITTLQCQVAERNNTSKLVTDTELFFEFVFDTPQRKVPHIIERLELFKRFKAGSESVCFGKYGIEEIPF